MRRLRLKLFVFCAAFAACSPGSPEYLDIATTTTVRDSGLLDDLVPRIKGITVRVHATDSPRAIAMLYDEVVDLAITHDADAEARALREQPTWVYRKLASSSFVLLGPKEDPAHVRQAADLDDAFRRIAGAPVTYVSQRGDSQIGILEQHLWRNATFGLPPARGRMISRDGIVAALNEAAVRQGYVLSDKPTLWRHENRLNLAVLLERDRWLLNSYAVIYSRLNGKAARLGEWLAGEDARRRIAEYRVQGRPVFTVWPDGCPDTEADGLPCRLSAAGKAIKDEALTVDFKGPPRTLRGMRESADAVVAARYTGTSHEFSGPSRKGQAPVLPRFERLGIFDIIEVLKPHSAVPASGRLEIVVPGSYQEFPGYILHTYADGIDEPVAGRTYVIFLQYLGSPSEGAWRSAWSGYGFYEVGGDHSTALASRLLEHRDRSTKAFFDEIRAR